jgi:hypothetical protein
MDILSDVVGLVVKGQDFWGRSLLHKLIMN